MGNASSDDPCHRWLAMMTPWPQSWAGSDEDIPFGQQLVAIFTPFVVDLQARAFTQKTIRRHLDSLWAIGGEIVREHVMRSAAKRRSPDAMLRDTLADGVAPWVQGASEPDQSTMDATARKLIKFLEQKR